VLTSRCWIRIVDSRITSVERYVSISLPHAACLHLVVFSYHSRADLFLCLLCLAQMHLGYKELRELLAKIHEARSRPRQAPAIVAPPPSTSSSQLAPPTPTHPSGAPGSGLSPTPSSSSALPPAGSPSAPPTGPSSDHDSRSRSDRDRERDSRGPSSSSSRRYEDEGRRDGGGSRRGYDDDRRDSRRYEDSSR